MNNASGFNLHRNFAFACTLSSPVSQSNKKPRTWSAVNLKKTWPRWALDLSLQYDHVILVSGYLALTAVKKNHNREVQYQRCSSYICTCMIMMLFFLGVRTYGQSLDNKQFWDWWVTKFSKVWGSVHAPSVCRGSAMTQLHAKNNKLL